MKGWTAASMSEDFREGNFELGYDQSDAALELAAVANSANLAIAPTIPLSKATSKSFANIVTNSEQQRVDPSFQYAKHVFGQWIGASFIGFCLAHVEWWNTFSWMCNNVDLMSIWCFYGVAIALMGWGSIPLWGSDFWIAAVSAPGVDSIFAMIVNVNRVLQIVVDSGATGIVIPDIAWFKEQYKHVEVVELNVTTWINGVGGAFKGTRVLLKGFIFENSVLEATVIPNMPFILVPERWLVDISTRWEWIRRSRTTVGAGIKYLMAVAIGSGDVPMRLPIWRASDGLLRFRERSDIKFKVPVNDPKPWATIHGNIQQANISVNFDAFDEFGLLKRNSQKNVFSSDSADTEALARRGPRPLRPANSCSLVMMLGTFILFLLAGFCLEANMTNHKAQFMCPENAIMELPKSFSTISQPQDIRGAPIVWEERQPYKYSTFEASTTLVHKLWSPAVSPPGATPTRFSPFLFRFSADFTTPRHALVSIRQKTAKQEEQPWENDVCSSPLMPSVPVLPAELPTNRKLDFGLTIQTRGMKQRNDKASPAAIKPLRWSVSDSKTLSRWLRHEKLNQDKDGYVPVSKLRSLIPKLNRHFDDAEVMRQLSSWSNFRLQLHDDGKRLRARYGHSDHVPFDCERNYVELTKSHDDFMPFMYHITALSNQASILQSGINKDHTTRIHIFLHGANDIKQIAHLANPANFITVFKTETLIRQKVVLWAMPNNNRQIFLTECVLPLSWAIHSYPDQEVAPAVSFKVDDMIKKLTSGKHSKVDMVDLEKTTTATNHIQAARHSHAKEATDRVAWDLVSLHFRGKCIARCLVTTAKETRDATALYWRVVEEASIKDQFTIQDAARSTVFALDTLLKNKVSFISSDRERGATAIQKTLQRELCVRIEFGTGSDPNGLAESGVKAVTNMAKDWIFRGQCSFTKRQLWTHAVQWAARLQNIHNAISVCITEQADKKGLHPKNAFKFGSVIIAAKPPKLKVADSKLNHDGLRGVFLGHECNSASGRNIKYCPIKMTPNEWAKWIEYPKQDRPAINVYLTEVKLTTHAFQVVEDGTSDAVCPALIDTSDTMQVSIVECDSCGHRHEVAASTHRQCDQLSKILCKFFKGCACAEGKSVTAPAPGALSVLKRGPKRDDEGNDVQIHVAEHVIPEIPDSVTISVQTFQPARLVSEALAPSRDL